MMKEFEYGEILYNDCMNPDLIPQTIVKPS